MLFLSKSCYQKAADMKREERESQVNQDLVKGALEVFLNLRTHSNPTRPKNIMIDSINMNLD